MIDGKFDVVFRGQVVRNMDESIVKSNLVTLFKSSPEAVDKLFSGNEVVVRKELDYSTAMKYQSALKKAGALALIKEIEQKEPSKPTTQGKASFAVPTQNESSNEFNSKPKPANLESAELTNASERDAELTAHSAQPTPQSSQDEFTVAEPGARILPDKVYEKREVDTSQLSLASVGERILPEKPPEEHVQPSIDHLKLED